MSDLQINPVDDGFDSLLLGFDFDEDLMNEMAIPEDVFRISGPVFKEVTGLVMLVVTFALLMVFGQTMSPIQTRLPAPRAP